MRIIMLKSVSYAREMTGFGIGFDFMLYIVIPIFVDLLKKMSKP